MLRATILSEGKVVILPYEKVGTFGSAVTMSKEDPSAFVENGQPGALHRAWPLFDVHLSEKTVHISISLFLVDGATGGFS